MIYLRIGILLFVLMLFLPSSEQEKIEAYGSIRNAIYAVELSCQREGSFCERSRSLAKEVAGRVSVGTQILRDALWGGREERESDLPEAAAARRSSRIETDSRGAGGIIEDSPRRSSSSHSTSTLTPEDRAVPWRGPGRS